MTVQEKSLWWKVTEFLWNYRTDQGKKRIARQDQQGTYSYAHWIKTVEQAEIAAALSKKRGIEAQPPSVCFLIFDDGCSEGDLSLTRESLKLPGAWQQVIHSGQAASAGSNAWMDGIDQLPGEWIVPVRAGDRLSPVWMELFCLYLSQHPEAEIFYWDEDCLSDGKQRVNPFFKPGWSPELLFSMNYLESAAFRKRLLCDYGKTYAGQRRGWIFDVTRLAHQVIHIPFVLQHKSLRRQAVDPSSLERHAQEACAYLERCGYRDVKTLIEENDILRYDWAVENALVSIVIPTKNNLAFLRLCLSTLLEKTRYGNYEILLMDDHSTDADVLAYYQELQARYPNIHIHENEGTFNYSRVNNQGARLAKGDFVLFLNNDVEIIDEHWLTEMVRWAQLPGVAMVGAKLLYPDRSIQHAGIVIGMTGHASHVFAGILPNLPNQRKMFVSPDVYRNVSAVTGACMLVRRQVFEQIGGFNEDFLLVFNDVEIGLRVLRSGFRVVYTPAARLIHYEGRSRENHMPAQDICLGADLLSEVIEQGDPYYNPNLSYSVTWPTLRRRGETSRSQQLARIVHFIGRGVAPK